jgi:hypothetical protein
VAAVLTRTKRVGDTIEFTSPEGGPQQILGGKAIANDKELITALVASDAFVFNQCRLAFNFLYGRDENSCEGSLFDKCVDAMKTTGTMQSSITALAMDTAFCE